MSSKTEPLIFIDANVYLALYPGIYKDEISTLIQSVRAEASRVISSEQLLMEVFKHRREILESAIKKLSLGEVASHFMSRQARAATEAQAGKIRRYLAGAKRRAERVRDQPRRHDPIYKLMVDFVTNATDLCLRAEELPLYEEIVTRARRRFELGYPPISKRQSCGDSLHWEWLVQCAQENKRDVTIVSKDSDFSSEFLAFEFTRRTRRRLVVVSKIAEALAVAKRVARAEEAAVAQAQEDFAQPPDAPPEQRPPMSGWVFDLSKIPATSTLRALDWPTLQADIEAVLRNAKTSGIAELLETMRESERRMAALMVEFGGARVPRPIPVERRSEDEADGPLDREEK